MTTKTEPNKALEIPAPFIIKESNIISKWRPALAWSYVAICVFDFIIAPLIMMVFFGNAQASAILPQGLTASEIAEILRAVPPPVYHAWVPLTLQSGGFFHITMGAILGIGSYTRGREKQIRTEKGYITE